MHLLCSILLKQNWCGAAWPAHRVDLLHRNLMQYGTIYNTLGAACPVTGSITAEPPEMLA